MNPAHMGTSRVEPRLAGCKSVTMTTKPQLLLFTCAATYINKVRWKIMHVFIARIFGILLPKIMKIG